MSIEVDVPYKYHRFIIGQRGRDVRVLMDQCDVKITVPSHELQSDSIVVTGPRKNCEEARHALERRLQQLEAEKEERVRRGGGGGGGGGQSSCPNCSLEGQW